MKAELYDKAGRLRFVAPAGDFIQTNHGHLKLLTLGGSDTAKRACWAHIVKRRSERTITTTNLIIKEGGLSSAVCVNPTDRYKSAVWKGWLIVVHEGFLPQNSKYLVGGTETEPSPYFDLALRQVRTIPYKPEWKPYIWRAAIASGLLNLQDGFSSVNVWEVRGREVRWELALKEAGRFMKQEGVL